MALHLSRRRKIALVSVIAVPAAAVALVWAGAAQIVQPPRGKFTAYSREWADHPAAHGLRVSYGSAADGRVPYLIAEPDATAGAAERGLRVRQQIAERGTPLRPFGEIAGTLVLLHGRTGRKEAMLALAERFCAAGFRCVVPDLPAHGASPVRLQTFGANAFEAELPARILAEASASAGFAAEPAGLFGMSMGGAFAVSAARSPSAPWRAVVLLSTFDALPELARSEARAWVGPLASLFAPPVLAVARWRSGVDPAEVLPARWAREIKVPTLVAHGTSDPLIDRTRGQKLYEALGSPTKRWVDVPGGTHDRVLTTPLPLFALMSEWFLRWVPPMPPSATPPAADSHAMEPNSPATPDAVPLR